MDTRVYYVQCISGDPSHVMEVIPGSELEKECKARAAAGKLDALILSPHECPNCIEESRERNLRTANMCSDMGCPFMSFDNQYDPCAESCTALRNYRDGGTSPYDGQLCGLSANAS